MITSPVSVIVRLRQNCFVKILGHSWTTNIFLCIFPCFGQINYAVFLVSGCGAGEYLNDGNSGNSMCSSCQPGEYQALEFHRQTSCQRCSGIQNTPKGAPGTQDLLVQFLSFHTVLEGNGQNNRLAPHL